MDHTTKVILIVGAVLVVLGLIVFAVVMALCHGDLSQLNTTKYITNTHTFREAFTDISVDTDTADILFGVSDDESCKVACKEQENLKHLVSVQNGALSIRVVDERKWYEYIGISLEHPQITVYLPEQAYGALTVHASTADVALPRELGFDSMDICVSTGDVSSFASVAGNAKIETTTGNIYLEGISPEALELSVTTGQITVSRVTCSGDVTVGVSTGTARLTEVACHSLRSTGSTGDLELTHVVAADSFDLTRSTGDIRFDRCDAAQITAKTETGHIIGSLLSEKIFIAQTSTGRVNVPKTTTGGRCEVSTDTGNIQITVEP
jgi:DUF4097 and DUF4098 domain-containing protein YvlB